MYPRYILLAISLLLVAFPSFAQAPRVQDALDYITREAPSFGLSVDDVADLAVTDAYVSRRSGTTHVYLQQRLNGIDVIDGHFTVNLDRNGRVFHAAGNGIRDLTSRNVTRSASLAAVDAVYALASDRGLQPSRPFSVVESAVGTEQRTTFSGGESTGAVSSARLVYRTDERGTLRLAWETEVHDPSGAHGWVGYIDAATGEIMDVVDRVIHDDFGNPTPNSIVNLAPIDDEAPTISLAPYVESASRFQGSYNVFAAPLVSPLYATPPHPGDGRTVEINPDNATASPFGWHDNDGDVDPDFTTTQGNNVWAYTDTDANNTPDPGSSPDGTATLTFNFALDLSMLPSTYGPAAVTNLFYWNNIIHDVMYQYGFDEAAGNFQDNNYGNGGVAGDFVRAEAQDGSDTNNASFCTPADGGTCNGVGFPRMQMYLGDPGNPTPNTDGDFDNLVIVHEYAHGISNRLTGGPASVCLNNSEQMGEGWSDWIGLMLTFDPTHTRTTSRAVGNYLFGLSASAGGIRSPPFLGGAPYSTDFGVNSFTYGDAAGFSPSPHGIGFVWATALWEMSWDLIDELGYNANVYDAGGSAGNQIALALVTEGLKNQPCSPGFVTGRDAILAADLALYPDAGNPGQGLHYATLWQAFARRGLGVSASQGTTSIGDETEAFDTPLDPPIVDVSPTSVSTSVPAPGDMTSEVVAISNTALAGSEDLDYTITLTDTTPFTGGGNSENLATTPRPPASVIERRNRTNFEPGISLEKTLASPMPATPGIAYRGGGIVANGSFEAGTPNPFWTEASTNFGTPICSDAFCGSSGGPNTGTWFVWFGGITGVSETGSVEQSVTIPSGVAATLSFWHVIPGAGTTGFMRVLVDGNQVFESTDADAGTYLTYTEITADVTAYADGAAHTLRFESTTDAGAGPLNFFLDDVSISTTPIVGWVSATPDNGSVAPGGSDNVTLDFDATGLTSGTYTADMDVDSNDPMTPTVTVPITFIVGVSSVTIDGVAGWRYMAPAMAGMTVDSLAAQNLVQGIPGYYPSAATNLYTAWDGSAWTAPSGGSDALTLGEGFAWYFYDNDVDPGGPSVSVSLPMDIVGNGTAASSDVSIGLHSNGDNWNLVGNPFTTSLDVTLMGDWVTSGMLASVIGQLWDSSGPTYRLTSAEGNRITAWQGMFIENSTAPGMTYPTTAQTTGGVFYRHGPTGLIAFELEGTVASTDEPTLDAAMVLYFHPEADAGWDLYDATKLNPFSASYATLAFVGERDGDPVSKAQEARSFEAENFIVPLSFNAAGTTSSFTLRWPEMNNIPDTWEFVLHDLDTGASVNLREVSEYTFQAVPTREAQQVGPLFVPAVESARGGTLRFELDVTTGVTTSNEGGSLPTTFALNGAYPNPFNPATTVRYDVPLASDVQLEVFDMLGRRVALLVDGRIEAGRHAILWNAENVASGVYVIRMLAGDFVQAQRMTLLK